ncbi:MAG: KOW domain-containing RNA-binding protein [Bacillota bacterium]|nr:KOW domain-containing RNA-binding protein [Bacillota bacterium]
MTFRRGDVVRSAAGHDKGLLFLVVKEEGDFLWLADGKSRKLEAPKKKRRKHVVSAGFWTHPVAGRMKDGEPVLDSEIRRALAAFRNRFSETEEV